MYFGCSSCQMMRLSWTVPALPLLVLSLIPAFVFYLFARRQDGTLSGEGLFTNIFVFVGAYMVGIGFLPILVFPIMLLALPLFLLVQLLSKKPKVRMMAILGLLPFVVAIGWQAISQRVHGKYWRLDDSPLPEVAITHLRINAADLGVNPTELLEGLYNGSTIRSDNVSRILLSRAHRSKDSAELRKTLAELQALQDSGKLTQTPDLTRKFEEAISRRRD